MQPFPWFRWKPVIFFLSGIILLAVLMNLSTKSTQAWNMSPSLRHSALQADGPVVNLGETITFTGADYNIHSTGPSGTNSGYPDVLTATSAGDTATSHTVAHRYQGGHIFAEIGSEFRVEDPLGVGSSSGSVTIELDYNLAVHFNVPSPDDGGGGSADASLLVTFSNIATGESVQIVNQRIQFIHNSGNQEIADSNFRIEIPLTDIKVTDAYTLEALLYTEGDVYISGEANSFCGITIRSVTFAFLSVEEVILEHLDFPSTSNWKTITKSGTVDGNTARVTAKIKNSTGVTRTAWVYFLDAETNTELKAGPHSAAQPIESTFITGEIVEIVYEWDTTGYAWNNSGGPQSERQIKVELRDAGGNPLGGKLVDLKVVPKPVILVHGLWSTSTTWKSYYDVFLPNAHPDWKGYAVDDMHTGSFWGYKSSVYSISENAVILRAYVEYVRETENAWHVDIVAHSMGGLISRYYIQNLMPRSTPDNRPVAAHLVMMGTPNGGSICAEYYNVPATAELLPQYLWTFNQRITNSRGVEFSILAGDAWPNACPLTVGILKAIRGYFASALWDAVQTALDGPGDTIVSKDSAYSISAAHYGSTASIHTDMTGSFYDFITFVKPQLAVGPEDGSSVPDASAQPRPQASPPALSAFAQTLDHQTIYLTPGAVIDIPVTVPVGSMFGVTIAAPSHIGLTLFDPANDIIGNIDANTPEANQPFRAIIVDGPTPGTWRVRLENQGSMDADMGVTMWIKDNPVVLTASVEDVAVNVSIPIMASFTDIATGQPITGATVTATVRGLDDAETSVTLWDDGLHDDGIADNGIYGGMADPLSSGTYIASVTGETANVSRITTAMFEVFEIPPSGCYPSGDTGSVLCLSE